MRFEDLQVTGSYQVTGSLNIPFGQASDRPTGASGSLFFNVSSSGLETFDGVQWTSGSEGSGGGGGGGNTFSGDTDYLLVAGGASGGQLGGGGAGGLRSGSLTLTSGSTYTITIGAGGAALSGQKGNSGGNSSIAGTGITTITSTGGGGGAGQGSTPSNSVGNDGGSGGGSGEADDGTNTPGSGTSGQGNDGGAGGNDGGTRLSGGGGGGAGAVGGASRGQSSGGHGGSGSLSDITGTSTRYAGGGGAGSWYHNNAANSFGGTGGLGGGGDAGTLGNTAATAGEVNTGGGGGGNGFQASGNQIGNSGAGGSGVAIFSYSSGSAHGAGGIKGDAGGGKSYHQFNSSDTFILGGTSDFNIVTSGLLVNVDAGDFSSRGTSTWSDLEGSNDGSVNGATLGANWYYDFDGSNDYISFSTFPNGADYKAFEIWINPDSYSNFAFQHGNGQEVENYLRFLSTDDIQLRMRNQTITVSGYSTNTWYHIVGQLDDDDYPNLWIDGTEVSTGTTAASATFISETVSLGRRLNTGASTVYWNGQIAQFRIYQNTLTDAQIAQNYNATKTNFV